MSISLLAREEHHGTAKDHPEDTVIAFPRAYRLTAEEGLGPEHRLPADPQRGDVDDRWRGSPSSLLPLAGIVSITAFMLSGIFWP